jgi:hypothetical protein
MKSGRRFNARLLMEPDRVIHSAMPATERSMRRVACARCGTVFDCGGSRDGACWCADESYRLPIPDPDEDCLCPTCLRAAARASGLSA